MKALKATLARRDTDRKDNHDIPCYSVFTKEHMFFFQQSLFAPCGQWSGQVKLLLYSFYWRDPNGTFESVSINNIKSI